MHEPDGADPRRGPDLRERHEFTLNRPRFASLAVREPHDLREMHEPDTEEPRSGRLGSGTVASMPLMQIPTRGEPPGIETVRATQIRPASTTPRAVERRVHAGSRQIRAASAREGRLERPLAGIPAPSPRSHSPSWPSSRPQRRSRPPTPAISTPPSAAMASPSWMPARGTSAFESSRPDRAASSSPAAPGTPSPRTAGSS